MKKSIVTVALAGTIAVTGAAFAVPALAQGTTTATTSTTAAATTPAPPATGGTATATASAQTRLTDALKGLVTDGTITQAQADKVASTLAAQLPKGGPRGFGGRDGFGHAAFGQVAAAAAKALGVSEADLTTELRAGKSVADVAKEKDVDLATVTTAVTDAVKTQIAQGVKDGRITQAQADTIEKNLGARVTEELSETHAGRGDHGDRGDRRGPFGGPGAPATTPAPAAPTS